MRKIINNYYIEYFYIIFLYIIIALIVIQCFGEVIYCDNGSINSTDILLDRFDLQEQIHYPNSSNEDETANCSSVFSHYQHIAKRRFFWYTCVKGKQPIVTYNNFKQSWNPNTNVSSEIKKELIRELKLGVHKFDVHNNTFKWIVKPSSRARWSMPWRNNR